MDARTGEILFEHNANARLHPASLTKMMTLYIAFQEIEAGRLSLDSRVTVSKYAASQPPSRLGLKQGQKIALRYLIRAAAVKSANDAAAAIGDQISGDHLAFAKRMTRTAKQLGMSSTTFRNAHGLTADGHLSTARDMNILGRHLFYDFPQYYNIFSRRTADAGVATVTNTNSRFLDAYEGADGIKTGYTSAAGFNLTASAVRGKKRIIATVFGGTSTVQRNAKMRELMDIGFGAAKNRVKEQPPKAPAALPNDALIASAKPDIDELDVEGGAAKTVRVSGEVKSSPRPRARPVLPEVPDTVAIAMAEGIAGALAEVTAKPAPQGTLDFQAEAIAAGEAPTEVPQIEVPVETLVAAAAPVVDQPDPAPAADGSLDGQAIALAAAAVQPEAPASETLVVATVDPALVGMKPKPRPETLVGEVLPETSLAVAAAAPVLDASPQIDPEAAAEEIVVATAELVVTDPGISASTEDTLTTASLLGDITAVETVAGATAILPPDTGFAAATVVAPQPSRKAPIFDSIETADAGAEAGTGQEVVVVMSTSGGRHFGVNVGEYTSRYDAERALLKTALAESATLNEGLRKTSQSGGKWRASFMGLTEDQAELACRRLRARAVTCETVGG
ncbi:serine hydrolase [Tabrizicola sp.]|uniref:D-alanyl-D-alanine carboxypeptidase family protein n=1 Tax=Tabrizicola sp. TaxID=2005166 RepID=UPI003452C0FB